jgi:hypothetical protein
MLSVSRLCSIDVAMIIECGTVDGIKAGKRNRIFRQSSPQCHFVHNKSDMTSAGIEPKLLVGSWQVTA